MTEAQYFQLCNACDELLFAEDSNIERVSIPSLHIIREHPVFLNRYKSLFYKEKNRIYNKLLLRVKKIVRFIIDIFRFRSLWESSGGIKKNIDVMFVSHLLTNEQAGSKNDFYFGDIPNKLEELGYSVAIVLINHTKLSAKSVAQKWDKNNTLRVILSNNLPIRIQWNLKKRLQEESQRIKRTKIYKNDFFKKKLIAKVAEDALSDESYSTYRLNYQFQDILNAFNAQTLVLTFEGHAWERIVFSSARKVNSKIQCIAYQHAAIFRLQHAIRRNLTPIYNPDYILTAGLVGKEQLINNEKLNSIPIDVLGSDRGNSQVNTNNKKSENICLVIPEGNIDECLILFHFSLECALLNPSLKFIWRLHPLIDFKSLKKRSLKLWNLPKNITFSTNSYENDLAISNFALYRGTTAIVKAILFDLVPIYLKLHDEMSIDPLYRIEVGKYIVSRPDEFEYIIDNVNNSSNIQIENLGLLKKYCNSFYTDFNLEPLIKIINNLDS